MQKVCPTRASAQ